MKVTITVDMPDNCLHCKFGENKSIPLEDSVRCCLCGHWAIDKEILTIPAWCPLKGGVEIAKGEQK